LGTAAFVFACALRAARAVPFKHVASLPLPSGLASVDLSPDRSTLVGVAWYAPFTEGIRVWDTKTLSLVGDYVDSANTNWSVRVGADGESCWTTQYYDGNVRQIDLATGATLQDVPVGQWPGALELDRATGLLYVGQNDSGRHEGGNIVVVDTAGGSAIATLPLVNEPSHDLRLNSDGSLLYVHVRSPGDETLYKIRTADLAVLDTTPVHGAGERVITLSPDDSLVFVPMHSEDRVDVYDADTLDLVDQLFVPRPFIVSVSPKDPRYAIIVHPNSTDVDVYDLAVEEIVQTFEATSVGYTPDIAWDSHRGRAYVPSNGPDGAVMVLDYVIPEPATVGLLCVGLLAGLRRRGWAATDR
jgi:DNA-binding beta-propeller fold protein YncE